MVEKDQIEPNSYQIAWENITRSRKPFSPELFAEYGLPGWNEFKKISEYLYVKPSSAEYFPPDQNPLFVLLGPSTAGKDAVYRYIKLDLCPGMLCLAITATERPKRANETDGLDYYFLTGEQFKYEEIRGNIIGVTTREGFRFGIPTTSLENARKCAWLPFLRIDHHGLQELINEQLSIITAGILPNLTYEGYRKRLSRLRPEDADKRLCSSLDDIVNMGPLADWVVINPVHNSGQPTVAAKIIHDRLHYLTGTNHISPV